MKNTPIIITNNNITYNNATRCFAIYHNLITFATVNFNNYTVTNNAIKTLYETQFHIPNKKIIVFDNSNKIKFKLLDFNKKYENNITVYDNTDKKIIKTIDSFDYSSYNHTLAIQFLIDNIEEDLILFDSDVIFNKQIDFINNNYIASFQPHILGTKKYQYRAIPFLMYLNTKLIKSKNIHFFVEKDLLNKNVIFDTGASFFEQIFNLKIPYFFIKYNNYITHIGSQSQYSKFYKNQ